jgi:hypothetical protein
MHRFSLPLAALLLVAAPLSSAQKRAKLPSPQYPPAPKAPALIDPAGPTVSLTDSEALFDIAVALNACGYNNGLDQSDPIRAQVRRQVNRAIDQSANARNDRDQLCAFIDQHHLGQTGLDLAQYVSLALYVTPPPALAPSVDETDMPPDSTQIEAILPILRRFAQDIDLHLIWASNRAAYDAIVARLHDPLTKMIVSTNIYLKMPASAYSGRRFLVVVEPLLSPGQTNARIYGSNYVVVTSPSANDTIHMQEVRHVYLHYEIEPLIYARSEAIDRFEPFLHVIRDAPIAFRYREDITSLVVECMIRAIEARTMDTGVDLKPIPADIPRSELAEAYRVHMAAVTQDAAVRQQSVSDSMTEGFVLTQYFYSQLIAFEKTPVSLEQSIGEIVYGMDVPQEMSHVRHIQFAAQSSPDIVQQVPPPPSPLDLAETAIEKGDAKTATELSQAALQKHAPDVARANFILARADLMNGKMEDAQAAFQQSVKLGSDPRLLAWSHIYLGRILDVEQQRDQAIAEYKAALAVRDGQPDTKEAAQNGIKKPFVLPGESQSNDSQSSDSQSGDGNSNSSGAAGSGNDASPKPPTAQPQ